MELSNIKRVVDWKVEEEVDDSNLITVLLDVELHSNPNNEEIPYIAVSYAYGGYYETKLWNRNYDWIEDYEVSDEVIKFALDYIKEENIDVT